MSEFIDIVFDGPPGPESGRFVEVEGPDGKSIHIGTWVDRGAGLWALRIERPLVHEEPGELRGCPVHDGAVHGGEAEELRAGIEALLRQHTDGAIPRTDLHRLLDRVNARDSLAHLERQDELDGIDQGGPDQPAEVDLPAPPGPIGDETLDLDPSGDGR